MRERVHHFQRGSAFPGSACLEAETSGAPAPLTARTFTPESPPVRQPRGEEAGASCPAGTLVFAPCCVFWGWEDMDKAECLKTNILITLRFLRY